jgi:hypothetical protein
MGSKTLNKQTAKLSADYTTTNAWATVTGLSIKVLKTGYYNIITHLNHYITTSSRAASGRYAIDSTQYGNVHTLGLMSTSGTVAVLYPICIKEKSVYLKKGETVTFQAIYQVGATQILYTANVREPKMEIIEVA